MSVLLLFSSGPWWLVNQYTQHITSAGKVHIHIQLYLGSHIHLFPRTFDYIMCFIQLFVQQ
jgi:hypothetical protein